MLTWKQPNHSKPNSCRSQLNYFRTDHIQCTAEFQKFSQTALGQHLTWRGIGCQYAQLSAAANACLGSMTRLAAERTSTTGAPTAAAEAVSAAEDALRMMLADEAARLLAGACGLPACARDSTVMHERCT